MADTAKRSGDNTNKTPIHVSHAELDRADILSSYRSKCPVCSTGTLLLRRSQHDLTFEAVDSCTRCGQRVVYDDIDTLRKSDTFAKRVRPADG
jgi:hypothetical protein